MTTALIIVALLGIGYCAVVMTRLVKLVRECLRRMEGRRW